MFDITVVAVNKTSVRVRVDVVHPDQWEVHDSKNFALQCVVDGFWRMKMGYLYGTQPAPKEDLKSLATQSPVFEELEELLTMTHGREVPISKEEYDTFTTAKPPEGVASWGSGPAGFTKHYETEWDVFCREAERRIVEVRLENEKGNPKNDVEDPDPSADVVFEVADERLIQHLLPGLHWDTAVYEFEFYRSLWEHEDVVHARISVPDFTREVDRYVPFDGVREAGTPECVGFSYDGDLLFFVSQKSEIVAFDGRDEKWRGKADQLFMELRVHTDHVALYSSDQRVGFKLLSGDPVDSLFANVSSRYGTYDAAFSEEAPGVRLVKQDQVLLPNLEPIAVAFSSDETRVAIVSSDLISVLNPATTETLRKISIDGYARFISFSPDGEMLMATTSRTLFVFRVSDGARLVEFSKRQFGGAAWSPDGTKVAVVHVTGADGFDYYGGHVSLYGVPQRDDHPPLTPVDSLSVEGR